MEKEENNPELEENLIIIEKYIFRLFYELL